MSFCPCGLYDEVEEVVIQSCIIASDGEYRDAMDY
jgi:hypothetical protein